MKEKWFSEAKKVIAFVLVVILALVVWTGYMNRKAEANAELLAQSAEMVALLIYGQSSIPTWCPIIPMPEIVDVLRDGQLGIFLQAEHVLKAQIANAGSQSPGYYLSVVDPAEPNGKRRVLATDWLLEVAPAAAALRDHITALQSN